MQSSRMEWPYVNPGEFRHRGQIQSQTGTADATGQLQQSWTTIWSGKCSIRSLTLRELDQTSQLTSQVTHMITLLFRNGVNVAAGMRVVFASHTYKIQAVDNPLELGVQLRLLCLELNAVQ